MQTFNVACVQQFGFKISEILRTSKEFAPANNLQVYEKRKYFQLPRFNIFSNDDDDGDPK